MKKMTRQEVLDRFTSEMKELANQVVRDDDTEFRLDFNGPGLFVTLEEDDMTPCRPTVEKGPDGPAK